MFQLILQYTIVKRVLHVICNWRRFTTFEGISNLPSFNFHVRVFHSGNGLPTRKDKTQFIKLLFFILHIILHYQLKIWNSFYTWKLLKKYTVYFMYSYSLLFERHGDVSELLSTFPVYGVLESLKKKQVQYNIWLKHINY